MKLIKANNLKRWADTLEIRGLLSELIRRLVHVTKLHLSKVYIPTEESTHSAGWDGIVISEDNDTYLPAGTCLIEMGTNENVAAKANDDYTKRTKDSLGFEKEECTFVFITPREWPNAPSWETDKNKLNEWKKVKVITAVELEDWLSYYPSVALWLTEKLNISHRVKIQSIESYWHQWSTKDKGQQLCYSVAIGGRKESVKELLEKTEYHIAIDVCSHSIEESLAFVVATILQYGDDSLKIECFLRKTMKPQAYWLHNVPIWLLSLVEMIKTLIQTRIVWSMLHIHLQEVKVECLSLYRHQSQTILLML